MELPSDYVAPILRVVRRMSLEEDIRLLASQMASLEQFLQAVRGTRLAARAARLEGVDDVEEAAWGFYADVLAKLAPLESVAPRTYGAYSMLALAPWLARLVRASIAGSEPPRSLPRHPLLRNVARILGEAGVRALPPLLEGHGLRHLALFARSPRLDPAALELAVDLDTLSSFSEALRELGESRGAEHVCYRLDALAVRAAGTAALLESRDARRAVEGSLVTCLASRHRLLEAVEEGAVERVAAALHGTPYHAYLSPRLPPAEAAYHAVRKYSRARLAGSLASDPTEPGHAAAVLELIALDVEDVVALATAAFAGLGRDVVGDVVSLPV